MTERIDEAVRRHAAQRPDTPAFIDPRHSLTWSELDASADRFAGHLVADGVGPGDRVAYVGPNSSSYAITVLGTWRVGASIVGLNFLLAPDDLRAVTESIDLTHLVIDEALAPKAEHISTHSSTVIGDVIPWSDAEPIATPHAWDDDAEALVYFTSGSTGRPKAVPLTRAAVESSMRHSDVHEFSTRTRALIIPPSFHAAGATWANYAMHTGATVVYIADPSPAGIIDAIAEHGITHSILVPTLIHSILEELKRNPRTLPTLHQIGYGASPITQHLLKEALALLDCDFCQIYGLTESGGAAAYLAPKEHLGEHPVHLASAGQVLPGFEVAVRDATGRDLPAGESGEIWFRGPSLTKGYLDNPTATAQVIVDGWLNTRDVGFLDDDGFIFIKGRSDDMIQTGGENVHPGAVEEVLAAIPGVDECAVFGIADPHWGQRVTAAVVTDRPLTDAEVIEVCKEKLAPYQVPKAVVFLDELPRTATGKVQRKVLASSISGMPA